MDTKVLTDASVLTLVDQYIAARREVDVLPDALERQIGLAALRVESQLTLDQAATTARVEGPQTLAPLRDFVDHNRGGEQLEKALAKANDKAAAAAASLSSYVATGIFTGVWVWPAMAGVLGFALSLTGALEAMGQAVSGVAFVGGGLWILGRFVAAASESAANAANGSWTWAQSLGTTAERTLSSARAEQRRVWTEIGGRGASDSPIAKRVRGWAQLGVAALVIVSAVGVIAMGIGFAKGFEERTTPPPLPRTTFNFTP
ncbi:hypothetical protein [Pedococcus soli]